MRKEPIYLVDMDSQDSRQFFVERTFTNESSAGRVTMADVLEAAGRVRSMAIPAPTKHQLKWAAFNGYPGWPSFKLGSSAYLRLKKLCGVPAESRPAPHIFDLHSGIKFVVDETLDPDAILNAATEYKRQFPDPIAWNEHESKSK